MKIKIIIISLLLLQSSCSVINTKTTQIKLKREIKKEQLNNLRLKKSLLRNQLESLKEQQIKLDSIIIKYEHKLQKK